jgi:predicted flap endonuclease-1-like 5' DNA nuclease
MKNKQMKTSSLENTSVQTPAQLARLSGPHGYRLDGDTVHLNAMFALLDPAAHERAWALQLWACPSAPASAGALAGHIVAEAALPPMGEIADEIEHLDVSAAAWPPAGAGEHVMVLVLASGRPGQFHDIHDLAVYPRPQQFIQPRMSGNAGCRIDGARVQISVGHVENPRPETNRSGTLSLELWALSAPFAGGRFQGHHLAGVEIGSVNGQGGLALQPIDLAFTPPPAGDWQIVLMLREWTAAGFVTRDFANFATRFVSMPVPETSPAPTVKEPSVPIAEKLSTMVVGKPAAPAVAKAPAPEVAKPAAPAAPAQAPVEGSAKRASVNTAGIEELAAVKGLSTKLAEGIVKERPFASLDDLRRVKGLGAKILAKVRSSLKL